MKKYTKLLGVLLALTMTISMFAGCGSSAASGAEASEAASAAASAAEETTEEAATEEAAPAAEETAEEPASAEEASAAEEAEPVDLTVSLPITTDDVHVSYFVSFPGVVTAFGIEDPFNDYYAWQQLAERTGVTIDWNAVSTDVETDQFYLMIASSDYVDMFGSSLLTNSMDFYYDEGVVLDLKDAAAENMPNYMNTMELYPDFADSCGIESDEGRWLCLHSYYTNTTYNGGMFIRQDWLDQLGLDAPKTIDQYHEVLTAFKNELGAEAPMFLNYNGTLVDDLFASAFGVKSFYNDRGAVEYPIYQEDGVIKYGPAEDGYYDYLKTMAQWYSEGLIYADFVSYTSTNTNPPEDMLLNDEMGLYTTQLSNANQYEGQIEGLELTGAYTPVLNEGDSIHFDWREDAAAVSGLCISTAVDEDTLPVILKMWDYTMSEDGQILANYGVEGETFEYDENGTPQYTSMVTDGALPALDLNLAVYTLGTTAVTIIDKSRTCGSYEDFQMEAMDIWDSNVDGAWDLPALMTLNADESEAFSAGISDILTYVNTFTLSAITGTEELTEASWDEYVQQLETMGLQDCLDQYQSAYDRYLEKVG